MATYIWVNIGLGNGLLPDGTKPLPEPMFDLSSIRSRSIHLRAISKDTWAINHWDKLEITSLKFHPYLPGANDELNIINHSLTGKWRPFCLSLNELNGIDLLSWDYRLNLKNCTWKHQQARCPDIEMCRKYMLIHRFHFVTLQQCRLFFSFMCVY